MQPQRMSIRLVLVAAVALLSVSGARGDDGGDDDQAAPPASSKGLRKVMVCSTVAISKLRLTLKKYQHDEQLSDSKTQALLSDCMDLTEDSKDVLEDSLSILVKLHNRNESSSSSGRRGGGGGGGGGGDEDEEMELLRTNLSAALTDITTCTDGLHDEISDPSAQTKRAVGKIDHQAARASELLSKALNLTAAIQG